VLNEYLKFHELNNFSLDKNTIKLIKELSIKTGINTSSSQFHFLQKEFFKNNSASFFEFCKSRHTSRNFSKEDIPIDTIYKCIDLANRSPQIATDNLLVFILSKIGKRCLKFLNFRTVTEDSAI